MEALIAQNVYAQRTTVKMEERVQLPYWIATFSACAPKLPKETNANITVNVSFSLVPMEERVMTM